MRFLILLLPALLSAQSDWPYYGHDPGGMRHSPLTQITAANVQKLERVWTFHGGKPGSQVTPLVIGGTMYITSPGAVHALEPETGKEIWKFSSPEMTRRGVAYWPGSNGLHPGCGDVVPPTAIT